MRRSPRNHRPPRLLHVITALPLLAFPSISIATVPWQPTEVVDSPVSALSPSSGVSVLYSDDRWHIVYPKGGDLYYRARVDSGWLAPEQLTLGATLWGGPSIAQGGGYLHVVWEGPHYEIYTRRWNGTSWSASECLSCDSIPYSWSPVIAGLPNRALVAWQEFSTYPNIKVRGRLFENGAWNPIEDISDSPESATDPTVSEAPSQSGFLVAWADTREGDPQIYVRTWNPYGSPVGWQDAQRVTNLAGGCALPSIHGESCCEDVLVGTWWVVFESPANSPDLHDTYVVGPSGDPRPLSRTDDLIPSGSPNTAGYAFWDQQLFGGPLPESFITWTDLTDTTNTHWLIRNGSARYAPSPSREILSTRGKSTSVVGAAEGNPDAKVMAAWIEDHEGIPTLLAKRGAPPGIGTTAVEPLPAREGVSLGVIPNPCQNAAVLVLRLAAGGAAEIRILDAAGRAVRDLGRKELGAETRRFIWDTRDALGHKVSPGCYYALVRARGVETRRAFVVLR